MATEASPAPRRGLFSRVFYGWYIVGAGIGIHLWVATTWIYGMQLFFTPLIETFHWSRVGLAAAFSLQRIEGSVMTPTEGFLVDRFGPRKMVLVGSFLMGLGFVALSQIQELWMFYASVLIVAAGTSAAMGVPRTWAIVQWFKRMRGRAMGIGSMGGVFSGPALVVIAWLITTFEWRTTFLILGLGSWAVCLPLALFYRGRPEQYGFLPDGDPPSVAPQEAPSAPAIGGHPRGRDASSSGRDSESLSVRQALQSWSFWVLVLIFAAQTFGTGALNVHLIPYLESDDVGFSREQAASVLGFYTVLSAFGRLGGGWAADRFGGRTVMAVLLALQAAGFLILANLSAYWLVIPYAALYGTAFGGLMTARGVIVSSFFGRDSFGGIWGLIGSGTVVTGVIAPVFMGWVFDVTGSYRLALYTIIAVTALGVPLTFLARPPRVARQAPTPAGAVPV